jgi:hypothetical protein
MPCSTLEKEAQMHNTLAPLIAAGFLALAATPASADGPAGGCPAPYTLTAISALPPVGQPGATAIDQRGNDDGYVCLMPFAGNAANAPRTCTGSTWATRLCTRNSAGTSDLCTNAIGAPFNAIDNRVQS